MIISFLTSKYSRPQKVRRLIISFCEIMEFGIDKFIGIWESKSGYRLDIEKVCAETALVSIFDTLGNPVVRTYFNSALSTKLLATYDDYEGRFEVELWEKGKGFCMDIIHDFEYELDDYNRESLVPALIRNCEDEFLDDYYEIFGPLEHYTRANAEQVTKADPQVCPF